MLLTAVLSTALWVSHPSSTANASPAPSSAGTVVRVVDGDTVVVRVGTQSRTIRLIGVDTPESVKPGAPVECFGTEASRHTASLLPPGTKVTVTYDVERTDRYGRTLAYVTRSRDRLDVGAALVAKGFARPLVIAPNTARAAAYGALAKTAKSRRLGLWGKCQVSSSALPAASPAPVPSRRSTPVPPATTAPAPVLPAITTTLSYGRSARNWVALAEPIGAPRGVLVFVHGGAWMAGTAEMGNVPAVLRSLPAHGWVLASVEYSLAPAVDEAVQVREVTAAVRMLAERYGLPVVLAGSSAGGHIAALAALDAPHVDAVVLLAAPGDLSLLARNPTRLYGYTLAGVVSTALGCAGVNPDGALVCSARRLAASDVTAKLDTTAPPAYIAYGDRDEVVTVDQSRDLAHAWTAALGSDRVWVDVVEGADHGLAGVDGLALGGFLALVAARALPRHR